MKKLTANRQRLLMILAGASIGLLILDSLMFTPLTKAWQTRSVEVARLKKSVTEGRSVVERAARTQALWKEMQDGALVADPATAEQDLITQFDKWGRAGGVELGSIKPQWKRGATNRYSLLECRVDATGTLAALTRFLYEVEKSSLALRLDSIELTGRDDNGHKLSLGLLGQRTPAHPLEARK